MDNAYANVDEIRELDMGSLGIITRLLPSPNDPCAQAGLRRGTLAPCCSFFVAFVATACNQSLAIVATLTFLGALGVVLLARLFYSHDRQLSLH